MRSRGRVRQPQEQEGLESRRRTRGRVQSCFNGREFLPQARDTERRQARRGAFASASCENAGCRLPADRRLGRAIMASEEDEAKLLQEAKSLPFCDRLTHKHWKVRSEAYLDVTKEAVWAESTSSGILKEFGARSSHLYYIQARGVASPTAT